MSDPIVDRWRLEGSLHLWRYDRPSSGMMEWHFNADEAACRNVVNLIDRMLASTWKTSKRVPISVPQTMKDNPGATWTSAPALVLRFQKDEHEDNFWDLKADADTVYLTMGVNKLLLFQRSVAGLPKWKDDFAIGPDVVDMRNATGREEWESSCYDSGPRFPDEAFAPCFAGINRQ